MNWHVECAAVLLLNAETCLPFLHQLRVCTKKPNKMVMKVWNGLSCKFTMAAFAARTVFFLEIVNPIRYDSAYVVSVNFLIYVVNGKILNHV